MRPVTGQGPGWASERVGTAFGLAAVVLWGTTVAVGRSVTAQLGPLLGAASLYTICALVSSLLLLLRPERRREALALPRRYLVACGGLFVGYALCFYLALGLASGSREAIEVGIVNYLWPAATVVLSVPLLGKRARWTLLPGAALATAGVALASLPAAGTTASEGLHAGRLPHLLALAGALVWALYSNLSRRWAPGAGSGAVPLFLIATALALWPLALAAPPAPVRWTPRLLLELLYLGLFPTTLGYTLWEAAMRRGNLVRVAAFSYLTPLVSAVVASLYLGSRPGPGLWPGCALLVAGAWLCDASVRDAGAS